MPAKVSWGGTKARCATIFTSVRPGFRWLRSGWTGPFRAARRSRSNFHQGNIYRDDFWEVWQNRFQPFRDRSWARTGACATCDMFRYCQGRRDAPARRRRCIALLPLSSALTSSSYLFRDLYSGIALASIVRGHRNNALSCIFRAVVLSGGSAYCRFPARALFHLPYFLRIHRQYPVMGSVAPSMAAAKARIRVNRPPQLPTCTE